MSTRTYRVEGVREGAKTDEMIDSGGKRRRVGLCTYNMQGLGAIFLAPRLNFLAIRIRCKAGEI